jgi:hypothetical protein
MTHSTSRGLLYTAPPAEDERAAPTTKRPKPTVEEPNRGHAAADD